MKALIIGLGSIGRRHLNNLRTIDPDVEIGVWHSKQVQSDPGSQDTNIDRQINKFVFQKSDALEWRPDIALITGPSSMHIETGLDLARHGIHLFIEKPISDRMENLPDLLQICRDRHLALMVGYNFRFYEPLRIVKKIIAEGQIGQLRFLRAEVGQYLPDWRPGKDYRQSVSARKALGGGVLLELSHEIDYALWLAGDVKTIFARSAKLSDLQMDVEDTAEIVLQFVGGGLGSIHVDMIQRVPTRTCRVIGSEGTVIWDWRDHTVRLYSARNGTWHEIFQNSDYDRNTMYLEELRHFLTCVQETHAPEYNTGEDGMRTLEIILAAKGSASTGREVNV